MAVTFTNNRIDSAICAEQKYQSKVNPAGVVETSDLAAEVAENLKDSASYVEGVLKELNAVAAMKLAQGERVLLDGLCRLELMSEGSFATEDEPWDILRHRIVVRAIPYDAIKSAAKDVVPVNTLSPVTIRLLGAQDAVTLEQNAVTIGNTLLCQGKNINVNAANEEEGLFLVMGDGTFRKLTIIGNTAGTIDATVPAGVAPGTYTLEVRGRAGLGRNRMLVTSSIADFVVKAA